MPVSCKRMWQHGLLSGSSEAKVGTESISPLVWAIETGALRSAQAILEELLTIRADRSSYYYSMKGLFGRHPDIIQLLCRQAPTLLSHLLDGDSTASRLLCITSVCCISG